MPVHTGYFVANGLLARMLACSLPDDLKHKMQGHALPAIQLRGLQTSPIALSGLLQRPDVT